MHILITPRDIIYLLNINASQIVLFQRKFLLFPGFVEFYMPSPFSEGLYHHIYQR